MHIYLCTYIYLVYIYICIYIYIYVFPLGYSLILFYRIWNIYGVFVVACAAPGGAR